MTPSSGELGQALNVAITGSRFMNAATTATLGNQIILNTVTVSDSLDAVANITIPANATTGLVTVNISTVTSGTTYVYRLKNAFNVTP